jgi:broad specificity phosphatase PhoE
VPSDEIAAAIDGENFQALSWRIEGLLAELARDSVVVAHSGGGCVLRGLALGLPTTEFPVFPVPQDQVMVIEAGGMRWL